MVVGFYFEAIFKNWWQRYASTVVLCDQFATESIYAHSLRVRRRVLTIAFRATFVLIHIFQCVAIWHDVPLASPLQKFFALPVF